MFEMAGGIGTDIHSITGLAAIILMVIHAVWATVVLLRKDEEAITRFHRFSVIEAKKPVKYGTSQIAHTIKLKR